jgi:hypothetical protein
VDNRKLGVTPLDVWAETKAGGRNSRREQNRDGYEDLNAWFKDAHQKRRELAVQLDREKLHAEPTHG